MAVMLTSMNTRLDRRAWLVLAIVTIFWIADGYDTFILLVTAKPALLELMPGYSPNQLPKYLGYLVAVTLAGWATGGILGGLIGDKLGRRKTMFIGVVIYSICTALSGYAETIWQFAALRFLTGVGIGSEWGVGTSLLQEVWPEKWRTLGAGFLQSGFAIGGLLVSGVWIILGSSMGLSWRYAYFFGIIPLVIILAIYKHVPESEKWVHRSNADERHSLFASKQLRRNLIASMGVSIAITGGWWAVTSFLPTFVSSLADNPRDAAFYAGWAGALYNFGEIFGCTAMGFLAESLGRRPTTILYFIGSMIIVPVVYMGLSSPAAVTLAQMISGFLTGGLYSWYTIHTPELFPTRVRATAISIIFSGARYLAMIGAITAGTLVTLLGGFGKVAICLSPIYLLGIVAILFLPETRNRGFPE